MLKINMKKGKAIRPITPDEIAEIKFPDEVIQAFNSLIVKRWNGREARVLQKEVVSEIMKLFKQKQDPLVNTEKVFENRWLDVEDIYRDSGWLVEFDKPGYNEDYEANFTFKRKSK